MLNEYILNKKELSIRSKLTGINCPLALLSTPSVGIDKKNCGFVKWREIEGEKKMVHQISPMSNDRVFFFFG